MLRLPIKYFGVFIFWSVTFVYKIFYPLPKNVGDDIKSSPIDWKTKIRELNRIRLKNIQGVFWANAGAVFALLVAMISLVFSVFWAFSVYQTNEPNTVTNKPIFFLLSILLACFLTLLMTPIFVRQVTRNLPAKQFAEISISNLDPSAILIFVAYNMWLLCLRYLGAIKLSSPCIEENNQSYTLVDIEEDEFDGHAYDLMCASGDLKKFLQALQADIAQFKATYYNELNRCREIKLEATSKLGILKREFCHHILKFSPSMFEDRINTFKEDVDALLFILDSGQFQKLSFKLEFEDKLKEVFRIHHDIKHRRVRSLRQIVLFGEIHEYVIGLSSCTSTSQSLKIFSRGISSVTKKIDENTTERERKSIYDELTALLHRSKGHYGVDLLVSLENFYSRTEGQLDEEERESSLTPEILRSDKRMIPKLLYQIKYYEETNYNSRADLIFDGKALLQGLRNDLVVRYREAFPPMLEKFRESLNETSNGEGKGRNFILVFGYSRMVRNILKESAYTLRKYKYKVFVMKEGNTEMLDTRILRFELNDQKPNLRYRESFTASDLFFFRLLRPDDNLIMLAGAEAFSTEEFLLIHTNNYQKRVEKLIRSLEKQISNKPKPSIWIVAGDFKIYGQFPEPNTFFGNEFYSDHYDKVDLYDFSKQAEQGRFKLISNIQWSPLSEGEEFEVSARQD